MRITTLKMLFLMLISVGTLQAQQIINVNTSTANCQCDTITVSFTVSSALTAGNQFKVELSDASGNFNGNYIELNPLLGFSVGAYNIDAQIPCVTAANVYKIRVVGNSPVTISDTLSNVVVGAAPMTTTNVYNTYTVGSVERFCTGGQAVIVGPAPPLGETYSYQWYNGASALSGQTDDTLVVMGTGNYSVEVTRGTCSARSTSTALEAFTPVSFISHTIDPDIIIPGPDSIQMCVGTMAQLNGPTAAAPEVYTYQWLKDTISPYSGANLVGLLGDTNQTLNAYSEGIYHLIVTTKDGGCVDTSEIYTIVTDTPPSTTIGAVAWPGQGAPVLSLTPGDSVMLSAADTVADWGYQWQKEFPINSGTWTNINGATNAWLKVTNSLINPQDTAGFRVMITSGTCEAMTNTVQVDYSVPVVVKEIINVNTSTQNCQCDTITVFFNVQVPLNAGNTFRVEMSNISGVFQGNFIEINPLLGFNIGSYQMDAIIPCTSVQGVYSVRVTGTNPVTQSDPVTNVIVGALPNTDITIYNTYSYGATQRFCDGDTAILVGPAPPVGETHQYQWLINGGNIPGETNDSLIVTTSGVYSVRVTRGLCDATSNDTIVNSYSPPSFIIHSPNPDIEVISKVGADSIRMCEGTVATLNAPTAFPPDTYKYQWYADSIDIFNQPWMYPLPNDTNQQLVVDSAGVFYVQVTAFPGGCTDTSFAFSVFVDTIPQTSITALSSLNLCYEDTVMVTALDTVAHPGWLYQWQGEYPVGSGMWVDSPNDTLPWIRIDSALVAFTDTVSFRLKITNNTCEYFTNILTVNFIPDPVFVFNPSDSVAICRGDSLQVFVQGNGLSYEWENGKLGASIWVTELDEGTLWCKATGVNQCTTFDTLRIGVFDISANAGPDQTIEPGEYAQLAGSGGVNYYWASDIPADFTDRFIADPQVLPTADTTAFILTVTGSNGCVDSDTMYVYVVAPPIDDDDLKFQNVQNVITPNGDGKNDMLDISEVIEGDECLLSIIDRWGREVYRADSYQNTWDGTTTAGEDLPDGTYYYILKCGDDIRFKGAVTIIRNQN